MAPYLFWRCQFVKALAFGLLPGTENDWLARARRGGAGLAFFGLATLSFRRAITQTGPVVTLTPTG
ncbi:MAG: hypothetical protein R3D67_12065 [Hyphomicrobiaceae bacterium]